MKTRSLLIAAATLLCAAGLHAQNSINLEYHASVSLGYAIPSWEKAKGASAEGVALGIILNDRHYLEAEMIYMKHKWEPAESGNLTLIPVLATYRYELQLAEKSDWYLQLGGSLGAVMQKYNTRAVSKVRSTYGAQAMAVYKINNSFSLNGGVRVFHTVAGAADDSGVVTLFSVGGRFRF